VFFAEVWERGRAGGVLHRQKNTEEAIRWGEVMSATPQEKIRPRAAPRIPSDATITCRPYASSGSTRAGDGVMRNFSEQGSYIEVPHQFPTGTILLVRMLRFPTSPRLTVDQEGPRSICLAEVKWQQELGDENSTCFGMGLRYLE